MQVNEVVVNGMAELSLVNDTVSEDTLLEGETAHDASGKQITGKLVVTPVDSELNAESENAIQNKAVFAGINNAVNGVKEYANGIISNPNLLDNWYFANPINQRGQTEYTGAGYGIDRWKNLRASNGYRVTSEGIQPITSSDTTIIQQAIEGLFDKWRNKTLTLSLLRTDGKLFTVTGTVPDTEPSSNTDLLATEVSTDGRIFAQWQPNAKVLAINLNKYETTNPTVTYIAAKLEVSPFQTLARQDANGNWILNDPPPNPATELAKCQWYYRRIEQARIRAWGYTANSILFFISYPEMRVRPTATIKGSPTISNMEIASYNDFTCSVDWALPTGCRITAAKTAHGLTDGLLHINSDSNVYIELSADL